MVTPKNEYSESQALKLLGNAVLLKDIYERDDDIGLRASIRREPDLNAVCLNAKDFTKYNDGCFFLLKLHYKQLRYSMKCLRWEINFEYDAFTKIINCLLESASLDKPLIIHLTIHKNGTIKANIEEVEPVRSLFDGLIDQILAVDKHKEVVLEDLINQCVLAREGKELSESEEPSAHEEPSEHEDSFEESEENENGQIEGSTNESANLQTSPYINAYLEPLLVYIDTEPTLPSYYTSFDTTNLAPYIEAHGRVSAHYLRKIRIKYPIEDSKLEQIDESIEEIPCNSDDDWEEPDDEFEDPDEKEMMDALSSVGDDVTPLMYNTVHQILSAGHEWCVAVYRHGVWVTPHLGSGCRNDPLRMLLLDAKILQEKFLLLQGLNPGEDILLISASRGVHRGCVIGDMPPILYKYTRSRVKQREQEKNNKKQQKPKTKFLLSEWMNLPNGRTFD